MNFKKYLLAVLVTATMALPFTGAAGAASSPFYTQEQLQALLDDGLTQSEAIQVLHFESIKNKLATTKQLIDVYDNKIIIIPDVLKGNKSVSVGLSSDDMAFLQSDYNKKLKQPKVTKVAKDKEIKGFFDENPDVLTHKFTFDDGTWVEISTINERIDTIDNSDVKVSALPNQVELANKMFPNPGTYSSLAEWKEFSGADYTKIFVTQTTYVGKDYKHLRYEGEYCGRASTGITSAGEASIQGGGIRSVDLNGNPKIWTSNVARATFTLSASHSITFAGVYNFTVNQNSSWDKFVQIRCSLTNSHYYSGIYGVGV